VPRVPRVPKVIIFCLGTPNSSSLQTFDIMIFRNISYIKGFEVFFRILIIRTFPHRMSPDSVITLITSFARYVPIIPGSTPNNPIPEGKGFLKSSLFAWGL